MLAGVDVLAKAVSVTLGPKGAFRVHIKHRLTIAQAAT